MLVAALVLTLTGVFFFFQLNTIIDERFKKATKQANFADIFPSQGITFPRAGEKLDEKSTKGSEAKVTLI